MTTYLTPSVVELRTAAEVSLEVGAPRLFDDDIVPSVSVAFDVDPWYVVDGFPSADGQLGMVVDVEAGIGSGLAVGVPYPSPLSVTLGAQSRWLALDGTYRDEARWEPVEGDERISLVAEGTSPVLDLEYAYLRGRTRITGTAMRLDNGDHFYTDGARWASEQVTVLMVVVLREPLVDFYGVIETGPGLRLPGDPATYVALRYYADGVIRLDTAGVAYDGQHTSGLTRPGQPVILGLSLSADRTLRAVVVDRAVTLIRATLPGAHPYDARLLIGRSTEPDATAAMDILDMAYWTTPLSDAQLLDAVHTFDSVYGVTVG